MYQGWSHNYKIEEMNPDKTIFIKDGRGIITETIVVIRKKI